MPSMKKLFISVLVIGYVVLGYAFLQTYLNNPVRQCTYFDTGTSVSGYHCKNKTVYILH